MNKPLCTYDRAWIGPCGKASVDRGFCAEHATKRCCSCGRQATHECCYTGQFVCGYPLCNDCEGWYDGTPSASSAWGFVGHHHRRKPGSCPAAEQFDPIELGM